MQKYLAQRVLLTIPTLFFVTLILFFVLRVLMPASVVDLIIGEYGRNDPQLRANLEKELGLSSSLPEQYAEWLGVAKLWNHKTGIIEGNLGASLHSGRTVRSELWRRVPVSLELGVFALLMSVSISIPLGVGAALRQDRLPDYGLRSVAILFSAVPGFWIAVMIITFGSIWFNWAPPINFKPIQQDPIANIRIMFLPIVIIGLNTSAGLLRLVRTQMLEVLRQDYVRTAQSKGLSQTTVLYKHALRNALLPVVTVIGVALPNILIGTVIYEQIFIIPGMGRYLVDAVNNLDYPVIEGLVLVYAAVLIFSQVLVDMSYAFLDPRIRFR